MFNNNYENYPYFQYNYELYPNREQQINFLSAYVKQFKEETEKMSKNDILIDETNQENENADTDNNNNEGNPLSRYDERYLDMEQLIKEANHFALASHLFWIFWAICQANVCKIRFDYLEYALARCDAYFKHKKILFPDGYSTHKS